MRMPNRASRGGRPISRWVPRPNSGVPAAPVRLRRAFSWRSVTRTARSRFSSAPRLITTASSPASRSPSRCSIRYAPTHASRRSSRRWVWATAFSRRDDASARLHPELVEHVLRGVAMRDERWCDLRDEVLELLVLNRGKEGFLNGGDHGIMVADFVLQECLVELLA